MIFQHSRFQVWNMNQHPYRHTLDEFSYTNESLPGVSTVSSALDYLIAVLYPQSKPAVANVAALPAVGNSINDFRVVQDDGDGRASAYRFEQREGDVAPKWYKIYDLDWGTDSILQGFLGKTQDIYVKRLGYDDIDNDGDPITGDLAGQTIYGGASASTNLTLFANSGDGTGAGTGYVQLGDNARPLVDGAINLGSPTYRFGDYFGDTGSFGTLLVEAGSITDGSGAISFGNENLSTTGTLVAGSLTLQGGSITDSSGAVSFGNENLTTTGSVTANSVTATGAASQFSAGSQIADFTFNNGNIASTSATVSLNALNITTSGIGTLGRVDVDSLRLDSNSLAITALDTNLDLQANGTGTIRALSTLTTGVINTTGNHNLTDGVLTVGGTGAWAQVDNLRLDGNTLSTTDTNGDLNLGPNGTGLVSSKGIYPTTDSASDLGKTGNVWNKLWIDGAIGDGTSEITLANLLTFRDVGTPSNGHTLFWDGSKWVSSAPDTEIDHGTISGLSDDDHTQYFLSSGRSLGQQLTGGTGAGESLTLESTANASKGTINLKDTARPNTNASYSGGWSGVDLGTSSYYFKDLYTKGQAFGLRLENQASAPSASTQNVGRMFFNTTDTNCYVDTGTTFKKVGADYSETDTVWNGTDTTKDVTVSGIDATKALWQLKDNTNDYEVLYVPIKATSATNVRISLGYPLPAGTYKLVGVK